MCFDPVDGSSNLDVNGIVGTIFSVLKRRGGGPEHARHDVLQPGTAQVAAGYIMYGPSTLLVLTTGDGVHGFTLDRARGAYVRTHANLRIPARGRTYSINDGNFARWPDGVRRFVEHVRTVDVATGRPYTARYAGSLVMDVHRTLLEGGLYLYPEDTAGSGKQSTGKLRLMYECSPMGMVIEQAGGRGLDGPGPRARPGADRAAPARAAADREPRGRSTGRGVLRRPACVATKEETNWRPPNGPARSSAATPSSARSRTR